MSKMTIDHLLGAIAHGIVLLDQRGRVQHWNAWLVRHSGIEKHEIVGKRLVDAIPSLMNGALPKAVDDAMGHGASSLLSHALHSAPFPLSNWRGLPMSQRIDVQPFEQSGEVGCLLQIWDESIAADGAAILAAERVDDIRRFEAVSGNLITQGLALAGGCKQLRSALNGLVGAAHMMMRTDLSPDQHHHLSQIRRAMGGALRTVERLSDLAQIEAGCLILDERAFSHAELFSRLETALATENLTHRATLSYASEGELSRSILGDLRHLTELHLGLIGEFAAQIAPAVVKLECRLRSFEADGSVELNTTLSCPDSAITKNQFAALQGHICQDQKNPAAALDPLGLAVAMRLVALMEGKVSLERTGGGDCRLVVTIRLQIADSSDDISWAPVRSLPPGSLVLVVDDDELTREVTRAIIEDVGGVVEVAADGRQAFEMVATRPKAFAAIVMDIDMPVMDGIAAARAIRSVVGQSPPIIALTAKIIHAERAACLAAGMDSHLTKPMDPVHFLSVLAGSAKSLR